MTFKDTPGRVDKLSGVSIAARTARLGELSPMVLCSLIAHALHVNSHARVSAVASAGTRFEYDGVMAPPRSYKGLCEVGNTLVVLKGIIALLWR